MTNPHDLSVILAARPDAPVRFVGDGIAVTGDYHVTEVKRAAYQALDCGRGRETWHETVIELLDGPVGRVEGMPAGKLASILGEASSLPDASSSRMIVEHGREALTRYEVTSADIEAESIVVRLRPMGARCKALERAFADERSECCPPGRC